MLGGYGAPKWLLYGTLFEKPMLHPQQHHPIDYCLLFNSTLAIFMLRQKTGKPLPNSGRGLATGAACNSPDQ
jgi:hypothetical protein